MSMSMSVAAKSSSSSGTTNSISSRGRILGGSLADHAQDYARLVVRPVMDDVGQHVAVGFWQRVVEEASCLGREALVR